MKSLKPNNNDLFNGALNTIYDYLLIIRNKNKLNINNLIELSLKITLFKAKQLSPFQLKKQFSQEKYREFVFNFLGYDDFVSSFENRFIRNDYLFHSPNKDPLIIDCGANIGDSVIYFKSLYPQSQILAFEPDVVTFNKLEKNIRDNNFTKVTAVNKALWNKKGKVKFYYDPDRPGIGTMSLLKNRMGKKYYEIDTTLLSEYIHQKVDFLKLDIEGAEGEVIANLDENKKLAKIDQMIIEYHHQIGNHKNKLVDILVRLEKNGFKYQFSTELRPPFIKDLFQDVLIYAYQ